jgi:hypothetical protein
MNHLPFILGAYAATFLGTGALVWASFSAMRRAEAEAEAVRRER